MLDFTSRNYGSSGSSDTSGSSGISRDSGSFGSSGSSGTSGNSREQGNAKRGGNRGSERRGDSTQTGGSQLEQETNRSLRDKAKPKRPLQVPFFLTGREHARVADLLRRESAGGMLLLGAIVLAMVAANSPLSGAYVAARDWEFGPASLHLHLSVGAWAADALLAIYFFLVGLELKRELKIGALRSPKRALVPVVSAFGGALAPALIFLGAVRLELPYAHGWAIPTATDIAIAVTLLGLIAPRMPAALRLFLLTLATVDDLIAIVVIAVAYTQSLSWLPLGLAVLVVGVYRLIAVRFQQLFFRSVFAAWLVLFPIGVVAWTLVHASGIHATIAAVALGFMIPIEKTGQGRVEQTAQHDAAPNQIGSTTVHLEGHMHLEAQSAAQTAQVGFQAPQVASMQLPPVSRDLASEFEHRFRPLSSGLALPFFAFFSAGVPLSGWQGITDSVVSPLFLAVCLGLVVGKPLGITFTAWVVQNVTRGELTDGLKWVDFVGMSCLAGVGFTMSLLISELSFASDPLNMDHAKFAVLAASTVAALVAALILVPRSRHYAKLDCAKVPKVPDGES